MLVPELIGRLGPVAARLGCSDELAGVQALVDNASYARQRARYAETRRLPDVVAMLAGELRASVAA